MKSVTDFCKDNSQKNGFIEEDENFKHQIKQIAKGGGIAIIGSIIGKLFTLGLHILLGRVLGAGMYGIYTLGINIMGIIQPIGALGLNHGVIRFCAIYQGDGDKPRLKGTILLAVLISLVAGLLVAAFLFIFAEIIAQKLFHEPELIPVLRTFSLSIPFLIFMEITGSFAQSLRRIDYQQGLVNIFSPFSRLVLTSLAFLLGFHLDGAVFGFLLSGILSALLGFYFIHRIFAELKSKVPPNFNQIKNLIYFSIPMMFVTLSHVLVLRIDRVMLGIFCDIKDVGIYSAAAGVTLQLVLIHGALVSIFMPVISAVYSNGQLKEMKKIYHVVKGWSSYATFFFFLPLIFYPEFVMSIYGGDFVAGWLLLLILPVAHIVVTVVGPAGALLQMTGKQIIVFLNSFLMLGANILLNYLLIPVYGYIGAAIATLLSAILMNAVQLGQIWCLFKLNPFNATHIRFIGLISVIFTVGAITNLFLLQVIRAVSFFIIIVLFFIFCYKNRTVQDKLVWRTIKLRLIGS